MKHRVYSDCIIYHTKISCRRVYFCAYVSVCYGTYHPTGSAD